MASWLESLAGEFLTPQVIVPAVGAIYSGYQTQQANQRAAELARAGQESNIRSINAGRDASLQRFDAITGQAQPANSYLRSVVAQDPNVLTPAQQIQMADLRRRSQIALNNSGLRGSTRATTASIYDVEARGNAGMVASNTERADSAARVLSGQGGSAQMQAAQVPLGAARDEGRGAIDVANTTANATTANAGVNATTLAGLAATFNRNEAQQQAERRYRPVVTGST